MMVLNAFRHLGLSNYPVNHSRQKSFDKDRVTGVYLFEPRIQPHAFFQRDLAVEEGGTNHTSRHTATFTSNRGDRQGMEIRMILDTITSACRAEARRYCAEPHEAWGFVWAKVHGRLTRRTETPERLARYARSQARKFFFEEHTGRLRQDEPLRCLDGTPIRRTCYAFTAARESQLRPLAGLSRPCLEPWQLAHYRDVLARVSELPEPYRSAALATEDHGVRDLATKLGRSRARVYQIRNAVRRKLFRQLPSLRDEFGPP